MENSIQWYVLCAYKSYCSEVTLVYRKLSEMWNLDKCLTSGDIFFFELNFVIKISEKL